MGGPDSALRGAACPGFDTERDRGGGGGTMTLHFSVTGHSIIIVRSYDCASVRAPTSRVLHRRDTHARNHGARTTTIIVTNTTYSASAIKSYCTATNAFHEGQGWGGGGGGGWRGGGERCSRRARGDGDGQY